jgi:hypothetical protein
MRGMREGAARGVQECRGATSPWTGTQPCEVRVLATVEGFGLGRRSTGTRVSLILWSPADVIPSTCGSGGTGRRASLRSLFPKGSGGSSPLFRTTLRSRRSVNLGTVFCPRLARAEPFGPIRDPPSHRGAAATPTQSVDVRRQAVQYYVCPRMPRLTGSGLDIHLLREGRLADADEAETLSIQRIRLATGGVRRSTLEGAELYRATVEMTADGQVS